MKSFEEETPVANGMETHVKFKNVEFPSEEHLMLFPPAMFVLLHSGVPVLFPSVEVCCRAAYEPFPVSSSSVPAVTALLSSSISKRSCGGGWLDGCS